MVNFNFIPVIDLPLIDIPLDWMHSEQTSQAFQALGLESQSTLVNNISLFTTLAFFSLVHLLLRYIFIWGSRASLSQGKILKFWNWLRLKIMSLIKYCLYLRLFIEAHESMLLSATNEINEKSVGGTEFTISYLLACGIFLLSIILPIIAFYWYLKNRKNYDPKEKFFFMEFFTDLRNASTARLYMSLLLTRRILLVIIIIFFGFSPREFQYPLIIGKYSNITL